jgi:hypothetical protein
MACTRGKPWLRHLKRFDAASMIEELIVVATEL